MGRVDHFVVRVFADGVDAARFDGSGLSLPVKWINACALATRAPCVVQLLRRLRGNLYEEVATGWARWHDARYIAVGDDDEADPFLQFTPHACHLLNDSGFAAGTKPCYELGNQSETFNTW